MRHLAKFGADRTIRCRDMAIFQYCGRPPSWIFQKLAIFTAGTVRIVSVCHRAKFRGNRTIHYGDMAIFDFS